MSKLILIIKFLCLLTLFNNQIVCSNFLNADSTSYKFIDFNGKFTIDTTFIRIISDYSEGLARAIKDSKIVYIDKSGKVIVDIGINFMRWQGCGDFSEGLTVIETEEMYDLVDPNGIVLMKNFHRKKCFINKKGEIIIKPNFYQASNFHEGLAAVETYEGWGFINKNGEFEIDPQKFEFKFDLKNCYFSEGLAPLYISQEWDIKPKDNFLFYRNNWGFIDKKGDVVIKDDFTATYNFSEGLALIQQKGGVFSNLSGGSDKLVRGKYGYIDKSGKIVIKAIYNEALSFSDGLAAVCNKKGKYGYINKKGKKVIKLMFDKAYSFSSGIARVSLNDYYYFIDKSGKYITNSKFKNAKDFSEGFAAVEVDSKWGYIDIRGKFQIEPKFYEANSFSEGVARVKCADLH